MYAMDCVFGLLLLVVTPFLHFVAKERRLVGTPGNHRDIFKVLKGFLFSCPF